MPICSNADPQALIAKGGEVGLPGRGDQRQRIRGEPHRRALDRGPGVRIRVRVQPHAGLPGQLAGDGCSRRPASTCPRATPRRPGCGRRQRTGAEPRAATAAARAGRAHAAGPDRTARRRRSPGRGPRRLARAGPLDYRSCRPCWPQTHRSRALSRDGPFSAVPARTFSAKVDQTAHPLEAKAGLGPRIIHPRTGRSARCPRPHQVVPTDSPSTELRRHRNRPYGRVRRLAAVLSTSQPNGLPAGGAREGRCPARRYARLAGRDTAPP